MLTHDFFDRKLVHQKFELNENGRDFVIGDLHGCKDMLLVKMSEVSFDKDIDRIFSVGDLVDRGPDSLGCLELLDETWFHAVKGNHELMFASAAQSTWDLDNYFINGGEWIKTIDDLTKRKWVDRINKMPFAITVETSMGDVGITHAEPPSDWAEIETLPESIYMDMVWNREIVRKVINWHNAKNPNKDPMRPKCANVFRTYHGHTPVAEPTFAGNTKYIDTGAVFGYSLTMEQIN